MLCINSAIYISIQDFKTIHKNQHKSAKDIANFHGYDIIKYTKALLDLVENQRKYNCSRCKNSLTNQLLFVKITTEGNQNGIPPMRKLNR